MLKDAVIPTIGGNRWANEYIQTDSSFLGMTRRFVFCATMNYLILMKPIGAHNYFVYITTNKNKTVLYTGITNDLRIRLIQHLEKSTSFPSTSFAGKYNAVYLIYYERFEYVEHAIEREKEIKGWRRSKKEALIATMNPEWKFLNDEID